MIGRKVDREHPAMGDRQSDSKHGKRAVATGALPALAKGMLVIDSCLAQRPDFLFFLHWVVQGVAFN